MHTQVITLPLLQRVAVSKDRKLSVGICNHVMVEITLFVAARVKLLNSGLSNMEVTPQSSVFSPLWVYFTPKDWCKIDHEALVVHCKDGKVIIDVPMKEYTYRDVPNDVGDVGHTAFWYWSGNTSPKLHFMRSARDIQEAWECKWTEAKEIAQTIKDIGTDSFYTVDLTVEELIHALS